MDADPPKRFEIAGEVDVYGEGTDLCSVSPTIGGENVVDRLQREFRSNWRDRPNVTVYLGVEPPRSGPLWTCHGFGGTDVTPPESPEIRVGDFDLVDALRDLDGRDVLLVVERR